MLMWGWLGNGYPFRSRVIANTKDGKAFRGILWQRQSGWLVLRQAELVAERGEIRMLDGEVMIALRDVSFLQVLPA